LAHNKVLPQSPQRMAHGLLCGESRKANRAPCASGRSLVIRARLATATPFVVRQRIAMKRAAIVIVLVLATAGCQDRDDSRSRDLEQQIQPLTNEVYKLREDRAKQTTLVERLENENRQLLARAIAMKADIEVLRDEYDEKQTVIEAMVNENKAIERELTSKLEEMDDLRKQNEQLKKQLEDARK
jgi:predicted RNase H-like nuclease (RuvC/YqgF family)